MAARSKRLPAAARRPEWSSENETLDHFERFAWTLIVPETGDRLKLLDWELCVLEDYFAGGAKTPDFFQHLWEIPSGNGKSGLLGALALHHGTYCVPRPRVFVIGGELEHARNTTNAAAGYVYESRARRGLLGAWWEPQEHSGGRLLPLWLNDQDVGIFARSAGRNVERKGGSSVEGKNPTLILVEEKHRHADGGAAVNTLIAKTIKSAAVGRVVKVVTITTAGTDRKSALGQEIAKVLDEKGGATVQRDLRPDEYYTRAIDAEGDTVAHIWEVPESVSPPRDDDEQALEEFLEHVKRANPAWWITTKSLRRVWRAMTRFGRWMFLRQNANMWVAAGLGALDRGQWWALHSEGLKIPEGRGRRVFVGLDRASKWDSTAIVPVWKPRGGGKLRVAGVVILESPRDGTRRKTGDVGEILEAMRERWPDMVIVFDRNAGGGDVAEELETKHGLTVIDHGQGTEFDLASMRLAEVVEGAKLEWDAADEYRQLFAQQVLAAVMKETAAATRWRGEAPDDDVQIDAFDALAMAVHMATTMPAPANEQPMNPDDYRVEQL
jgi:phage terminase large subunit-like protein